jgi:hypothetical protein
MRRAIALVALTTAAVLLGAAPALADPPGNNGTVKIDGVEFDTAPNNEPHVGCVFQVDFYGFDEGDLTATATFALHPPTGTSVLQTETADIGEDPAGGGVDLDAEITVDLSAAIIASGATPHPQQGFHVKLTVHAPGSIGADTKHKTFWVQDCAPYPPEPESTALVGGSVADQPGGGGLPIGLIAAIGAMAVAGLGAAIALRAPMRRRQAS